MLDTIYYLSAFLLAPLANQVIEGNILSPITLCLAVVNIATDLALHACSFNVFQKETPLVATLSRDSVHFASAMFGYVASASKTASEPLSLPVHILPHHSSDTDGF
ncbi:hypothetical protein EV175_006598, partial [Coemansia sp. RSA 1933]